MVRGLIAAASIVAALIVSAALSADASAAGAHRFRVTEDGGRLVYKVTVCTKPGRLVLLRFRVEDFNGNVGADDVARRRQKRRCTRFSASFEHTFPIGLWYARVKVRVPAANYSTFSKWRKFRIRRQTPKAG